MVSSQVARYRLIAVGFSLIAAIFVAGLLIFNQKVSREMLHYQRLLDHQKYLVKDRLASELARAKVDLLAVKLQLAATDRLSVAFPFDRSLLEREFAHLMENDPAVASMRWIDRQGMEQARVNRLASSPADPVLSADRLQDKSHRYYVEQAMLLDQNEVYVSPLDLNIENGKIVQPIEPTLRLAIRTGERERMYTGLLVVNYNLQSLWNSLTAASENIAITELIDSDGYRLFSTFSKAISWRQLNSESARLPAKEIVRIQRLADSSAPERSADELEHVSRLAVSGGIESIYIVSKALPDYIEKLSRRAMSETLPLIVLLLILAAAIFVVVYGAQRRERDLSKKLYRQLQKLEENSALKCYFLSSLSHEVRTPLTAVSGVLDLTDAASVTLTRKQKTYVRQATESLLSLSSDILDLSHIESDDLVLTPAQLSFVPLIEKVLLRQQEVAACKRVTLFLQLEEGIPETLVADGRRIEQLLNKLLDYALRFSRAGDIIFRVAPEFIGKDQVALTFSIDASDSAVSADELGLMLNPMRLNSSEHSKYRNAGVGLYLANRLLGVMESHIEIEQSSDVGVNYRFSLMLPWHITPQQKQLLTAELPADIALLIVSDSVAFIESSVSLLSLYKVRVDSVGSSSLREACSKDEFDLILVDLDSVSENIQPAFSARSKIRYCGSSSRLSEASSQIMQGVNVPYLSAPILPRDILQLLYQEGFLGGRSSNAVQVKARSECLEEFVTTLPGNDIAKILLVEDNAANRNVITEMLQRLCLDVEAVETGSAAVECIRQSHYDLVFMDIHMPVVDGLTTTRNIRQLRSERELPIYALSAMTAPDDFHMAREAGMNGYLAKPVQIPELREILLRHLPNVLKISIAREESRSNQTVFPDAAAQDSNGRKHLMEALRRDPDFDLQKLPPALADPSQFERMINAFRKDLQPLLIAWHRDGAGWDVSYKQRVAHQLKGAAAAIGAGDLGRQAEETEQMVRARGDIDISPLMEALEVVLQKVASV